MGDTTTGGGYNMWDFAKALTGMGALVGTYKKLMTPNKTQYGMTNQTKRKYYYNKFKLYKWIKRKKYKWIGNSYNYKLDYLLNAFVPVSTNTLFFKTLTENDGSNFQYNLIKATSTIEGTKLYMLFPLFDDHHICGAAIDYKPNQIVKTNPNNSRISNILFAIVTGRELEQLGNMSNDPQKIQILSDRPYVKVIAADDDCRIYRPFKLNKNKDTKSNDQVFYSWVPCVTSVINYGLYLVGCFVNSLTNTVDEEWDLGTIKVTLYYRFRNSKM